MSTSQLESSNPATAAGGSTSNVTERSQSGRTGTGTATGGDPVASSSSSSAAFGADNGVSAANNNNNNNNNASGTATGTTNAQSSSVKTTSADGAGAGAGGGGGSGGAGGNGDVSDNGREARIAQRKGRIELNRLARAGPSANEDVANRRKVKAEAETKDVGKSKSQINQSKRHVESVKRDGTDSVSNVRVGVVSREASRRSDEARKAELWAKKRNDVAQKAEAANEEIQKLWDKAFAMMNGSGSKTNVKDAGGSVGSVGTAAGAAGNQIAGTTVAT